MRSEVSDEKLRAKATMSDLLAELDKIKALAEAVPDWHAEAEFVYDVNSRLLVSVCSEIKSNQEGCSNAAFTAASRALKS